jgi:protein-L-isoaspartate(D-aspartate) O-methyltransferase
MIETQLRARGIVMHSVLEAMRAVPRHLFVAHKFSSEAYADEALPSQEGQTISQPYMVGVMTQELAVKPGHRILEIGTGTGYQTAILAHLVGPDGIVCTIERVPALGENARRRLDGLGYLNVRYFIGDGSRGWPENLVTDGLPTSDGRPLFDRILVTAVAPNVPAPLMDQLQDGGIMIVPVGTAEGQSLLRITRHGENFERMPILGCRFVPLVGTHGWQPQS